MKKGEVKNFLKKHKWEIIVAVTGVALGSYMWRKGYDYAIGEYDGKIVITNKALEDIIIDAGNKYSNGSNGCMTSIIENAGFNTDELGKLGDYMIEHGLPNSKMTHIVMFGPKPE